MTDPAPIDLQSYRPLAVIRSSEDFRECFRQRADELAVSRTTIDHVAGLGIGHTSRLLMSSLLNRRNFGPMSLLAMSGALGLVLVVCEDTAALERIRHRLKPRAEKAVRHASHASAENPIPAADFVGNAEWSRLMNARRTVLLPPARRSQIARKAATIRWRRFRSAEAAP